MKTLAERFWAKVERSAGCWRWNGSHVHNGYGQILGTVGGKRIPLRAHRVSWELHFGPIPDGSMVLHRCDVRDCVNPSHLFLGTASDNTRDMVSKGRQFVPAPRLGRDHWASKLTEYAVSDIRMRHARGETIVALAREYGVDRGTVRGIVIGRTWKHVRQ